MIPAAWDWEELSREYRRLNDGAFLANVPTQALRAQGADFVVAVNVVPKTTEPVSRGRPRGLLRRSRGPEDQRRPDLRDQRARIPPLPVPFWRARDAVQGAWLAIWKAGIDQAATSADVILDLAIDAPMMATWRAAEIRERFLEEMERVSPTAGRRLLRQDRRGGVFQLGALIAGAWEDHREGLDPLYLPIRASLAKAPDAPSG